MRFILLLYTRGDSRVKGRGLFAMTASLLLHIHSIPSLFLLLAVLLTPDIPATADRHLHETYSVHGYYYS